MWVLGILQENTSGDDSNDDDMKEKTGGKYGFIHQHFRDYFAAMYDINLLRLAVLTKNEDSSAAFSAIAPLTVTPLHRERAVFLGEILGEHHNKPVLKDGEWRYNVPSKSCDRNLIKRALALLHGRFGEEAGYGVYNLIEVLKLVREDLSGSDFSALDLSLVTFNFISLGHTPTDGADFHGAKVGMTNLLSQGHSWLVTSVAFALDSKTFLSVSLDHTIRVWDSATGQCIRVCEGHSHYVNSVAFAPDGKTFLSGSEDGTIRIWSAETGECLQVIQNYPGLIVFGCDMRDLHEGSDIDKDVLYQTHLRRCV